jgi:CPA2 family monovalent cation:H+ antiporter-2
VKRVALPGAIAQSAAATILGALLARAFGWDWAAGLAFGMALSVASTVVLVRVLADNNDLHTQAGHVAVGWLVVEDVLTVLALVLMPVVLGPAASSSSIWTALGSTTLKVTALAGFTALVGSRLIPRVLDYVARTRSRELFTLTVLVVALGIAAGSALIFSVSMALGAFLAGMIVGRSEYSSRAASEALPMRDAFAVLFFVSVGMLLNPAALFEQPMLLAGALAIVLVAKPLVALLVVWAIGHPVKVMLTVSIALSQIGEFSFILSSIGRELGVLSETATNTLVATAIVSIILNPILYRTIEPLERWIRSQPSLWSHLNRRAVTVPNGDGHANRSEDPDHRAVIIGFGPTGRTVARLLQENEIAPTVVELNVDTVRALREEGIDAVYGDAMHVDTLAQAGVGRASTLILTSAGMTNSADVIRAARSLNPNIRVLARAGYLRDLPSLKKAGADSVSSAEGEVALAFVEAILSRLGATPEQIERERARAHGELVGALDARNAGH